MSDIVDNMQPLNSFTTTLRERGIRTATKTYTGTIPISGTLTTTLSVPIPKTGVDSLKRISITGTGTSIDNYWYLHDGYTRPVSGAPSTYRIEVTNYNDGTNENFVFLFTNLTAGSTVTLPTLTLNARCRFYDAPWEVS